MRKTRNLHRRDPENSLLLVVFLLLAFIITPQNNVFAKHKRIIENGSIHTKIDFDVNYTLRPLAKITRKGLNSVELHGLPHGGLVGQPSLGFCTKRIILPADANLDSITVNVSGNWQQLQGDFDIDPAPAPATWDNGKLIISWQGRKQFIDNDGRDTSVYSQDSNFPENPAEIESIGEYREVKLADVKIWLMRYNPARKKIWILNNPKITLLVENIEIAATPAQISLPTASSDTLSPSANLQDINSFYTPAAAPAPLADYVIITTSSIKTNSTKLARFVDCQKQNGHTVKVVTEGAAEDSTHYVTGTTADSRANYIRQWLQNHRSSDSIQYVLLIGNPHPTTFTGSSSIPMKMCYPRNGQASDTEAPTDMFFAELSRTWDKNGNGYYGEYNGDYGNNGADKICEVKLGRIPFYGSYTDLDSILQKIINYYYETGSLTWRNKVLIPCAILNFGPQDNNGDGDASDTGDMPAASNRVFGDTLGEAIKSVGISQGFSAYTLYERTGVYSDGSAYPLASCNASLTSGNMISEWQKGYGFVAWAGHGSQTSVARFCWTSDPSYLNICQNPGEISWYTLFYNGNCSQLDNSHPSFVVEVSCQNGWPENSANLGYSLLKNGAMATVCSSRNSWYATSTWATNFGPSYADDLSFAYYIFQRMGQYDDTVAAALNYCRSYFAVNNWTDGSSWMNMLVDNLYGDPASALISSCYPYAGLKLGDFDTDNDVDKIDLRTFASEWLSNDCTYDNNWCSRTDTNLDGDTDFSDFALMGKNWKK